MQPPTSSASICTSKRGQRFFEIINPVHLLLDLVQLKPDSSTCWRYVLERSSGGESKCFLKFRDKCIRVQSVEKIDVPR